jgi:hypothetical protein
MVRDDIIYVKEQSIWSREKLVNCRFQLYRAAKHFPPETQYSSHVHNVFVFVDGGGVTVYSIDSL